MVDAVAAGEIAGDLDRIISYIEGVEKQEGK